MFFFPLALRAPAYRKSAQVANHRLLGVILTALLVAASATAAVPPPVIAGRLRVELQRVVDRPGSSDLSFPTISLAFPPDDSGRIFFVEKGGTGSSPAPARIRVMQNGVYSTALDLSSEVSYVNENGLLGMAFHPGFADPLSPGYRKLYTYHSVPASEGAAVDFPSSAGTDHYNVVTEWQIGANDPNQVDLSSRREIFREAHPAFEHNAGTITFGPDGYLYGAIGNSPLGSSGSSTTKLLASQDTSNLRGKVFRIDPLDPSLTPASANPISANGKYRVPADNPFVSDPQSLDEIFAYGFRNPYRFSVDSATGRVVIGDVGQGAVEEVDVLTPGGNYGWPYREGTQPGPFGIPLPNPAPALIDPITAYSHSDGHAVVGGFVYHGSIPALQGKYIFGDFTDNGQSFYAGHGKLFVSEPFDEEGNLKDPADVRTQQILTAPATCSQALGSLGTCTFDTVLFSFASDHAGELYALGMSSSKAVLYKFTDAYTLPEGDYNEDGKVDAADYTVWRNSLGQSVALGTMADGDGNGTIDTGDYAIWKAHFGESVAIGSGGGSGVADVGVPEPSALGLATLGALAGITLSVGTNRRRLSASRNAS